MRSLFSAFFAIVLCCSSFTQAVCAAIDTGDKIDISTVNNTLNPGGGYTNDYTYRMTSGGGANGGEFLIRKLVLPVTSPETFTGDIFKTFCIEHSETISLNGNYWVTVDPVALRGGPGYNTPPLSLPYTPGSSLPSGTGDPVGAATQWLFGTYSNSWLDDFTLASTAYTFSYNDDAWAGYLQEAIWFLEEEITGTLSAQAQALVDTANAPLTYTTGEIANTLYDVRAMNLWTTRNDKSLANNYTYTYEGLAQSQLILVGTTMRESTVPEPSTILIWGGLAGIGLIINRRRQSKLG